MDPVTNAIIGAVIAGIGLIFAIPPTLVALKQLFSRKPSEPAPYISLPEPRDVPPPIQEASPTVNRIFDQPDMPNHGSAFTGKVGRIFLAHAREDKPRVRQLYADLKAHSFDPWLDEEDLLPGQIWKEEIPRAIREAEVFLACLSDSSVGKVGFVQNEFRLALTAFGERPPGSIYLIPVRLDDCQVPDLQIPDRGLSLRDIHWVDLWQEGGFERLIEAITQGLATGAHPKEAADVTRQAAGIDPSAPIEPEINDVPTSDYATEPEPQFEPTIADFDPDRFQLENLPTPHSTELFGRADEKALLTREWNGRGKRNVLALIAEGGTGKSFLVSRWLAESKDKQPTPYAGAARIFTWSFYSQGSKDQVTSSEGFFSALIRSFGEDPEPYDSLGRADRALKLVCQEAMILVLDGVEPLQNPPGHTDAGRFHDRTIGDFVNRLAGQPWPGLALVTSRQRLTELAAQESQAVRHVDVATLKPEDGAALLRSLGVIGPKYEKQIAAREMGGHAFGLVLLGRYLVDVIGDGDIYKRDQVKLLYDHLDGAEKAKAMLQAYADWFNDGSAETAMLRVLGLFDRPVPMAALQALVAAPEIPGLTEPFHGSKAPPLAVVLRRLENLNLITRPDADTVDGHPLVREHFGAVLERQSPETWKQAHGRLFDYFCGIPDQEQPDDEAGLLPLYQSLRHGVAAGRAQEALDEVYYRRIAREGQSYGVHQLGLYSTELAALAAFFPGGWQTPVQDVTRNAHAYLLNLAGYRLRALGRLMEARTPFERNIALHMELENHHQAATNSANLSVLMLVRGELQAALKRANDAVDFIDKTEEKAWQAVYRAQQANVLAMRGKMLGAEALFDEAEQRQVQENPNTPHFHSVEGFFYISFLLRDVAPAALLGLAERVKAALTIAKQNTWLLDTGLDSLNLARIAARMGDETAPAQFDSAIDALRKASDRDYMPRGNLARAAFRRAQGDLAGAWEDLAEVRHIAEPSGMRLFLCDALIEEAWLHYLAGDTENACKAFEKAEAEVNDMGYHWQDSELDKLRQALG